MLQRLFTELFSRRYFSQMVALLLLRARLYKDLFFLRKAISSLVIQGALGFLLPLRLGMHSSTAVNTPFAVHYEKIRNHLRETAINSAKIHSLARKYEHLRINQIQLRFLHFNQHSITLLGIHMCH